MAAYAGGYLLRVRAEPAAGSSTLIHLCAGQAIGSVRAWTASVQQPAPRRQQAVAVLRVAESLAIMSAPLMPGRPTALTVTLASGTGQRLVFTTRVSATPAG
ncbi:hypothetical protein ACWKSP_37245 [Micromonosporaceae bacterium Da 78-11]